MIIKLLVDGGDMKPGPAIAQKLGPMGINMGKVIQDINKATSSFKGIKVPVDLDVDAKTKNFSISVKSPPVAELLKKELSLEKGSSQANKIKVGNLSIEQIISISKIKQEGMLANDFKSAVKSVVGSCVSSGILIENKEAKEIEKEIDAGKYDKEISTQLSETSADKKKVLAEYFAKVKTKQDEIAKKEAEAKAAEEAAKAAAATTAPAPGVAAPTPAAAGKETVKAEEVKEKKEEEKKK